jgi:hypothetical protein
VQTGLELKRRQSTAAAAEATDRDDLEAAGLVPTRRTWRSSVATQLTRSSLALMRLAMRVDPPAV